jgi:hypothetical protein
MATPDEIQAVSRLENVLCVDKQTAETLIALGRSKLGMTPEQIIAASPDDIRAGFKTMVTNRVSLKVEYDWDRYARDLERRSAADD